MNNTSTHVQGVVVGAGSRVGLSEADRPVHVVVVLVAPLGEGRVHLRFPRRMGAFF